MRLPTGGERSAKLLPHLCLVDFFGKIQPGLPSPCLICAAKFSAQLQPSCAQPLLKLCLPEKIGRFRQKNTSHCLIFACKKIWKVQTGAKSLPDFCLPDKRKTSARPNNCLPQTCWIPRLIVPCHHPIPIYPSPYHPQRPIYRPYTTVTPPY